MMRRIKQAAGIGAVTGTVLFAAWCAVFWRFRLGDRYYDRAARMVYDPL